MRRFPPARGGDPGTALSDADVCARVLYRDALMLVLDKPAGYPVHPGPRGGSSLEDHFDALRFGLTRLPHLAHRLDRDTSGCLLLGRHRRALSRLGELFSTGAIEKVYWAVVAGTPPAGSGTVDSPLVKRSTRERGWWMECDPSGQAAVTDYRVCGVANVSGGPFAWVELRPRTGRTHQIRVHLASLGCPVVGDPVYGAHAEGQVLRRLHLHSRSVSVPLYPDRDPILVAAAPPPHMHELLAACGFVS